MEILILSGTPLVNSPSNFKKAFNLINYKCDLVYIKNYPNNKDYFNKPDFFYSEKKFFKKKYDLILFHNIIDLEIIESLKVKGKKNILFIHSTPFDGPIYHQVHLSNIVKYFDKIFSLSQGHCRFYPNSYLFSNIIHSPGFNQNLTGDYAIRVNYLKSLSSFGRYGSKNPITLIKHLRNFFANIKPNKIKYLEYSNLKASKIIELKSFDHVTIDDLFTGAFHQNSLEALASGGVAINGADDLTLLSFMQAIETNVPPPFVLVKNSNYLFQTLFHLLENRIYLKEIINNSRDYYNSYLQPKRLIEILLKKIYE